MLMSVILPRGDHFGVMACRFTGGPRGSWHSMGTVMTSADGNRWTPAASWSYNQTSCATLAEYHGIHHVVDTAPLAINFTEADGAMQYIGISFGSGSAYMAEISLSQGTTISCQGCTPRTTVAPCRAGQSATAAGCQGCQAGQHAPVGATGACADLACPRGTVDHDSDPATECSPCPVRLAPLA